MDFIIIANSWAAARDNPTSKHQIALELVRQGHRVLWLEGGGMRSPALASSVDRSKLVNKMRVIFRGFRLEPVANAHGGGRLWVKTLPLLPAPRFAFVRRVNGWIARRTALKGARMFSMSSPVLINYVPVFSEVMSAWRRVSRSRPMADKVAQLKLRFQVFLRRRICLWQTGLTCPTNPWRSFIPSAVVYHCVDRWDAFGMYDTCLMAKLDEDCCEYADVVIASSLDLYERCRRHNPNTWMIPHGVDYLHFASGLESPAPADLPAGPVIGFFGLLSEWIDQDLLLRVSNEFPDCSIVLIGKPDVSQQRLEKLSNVRFMGPKAFDDLPAYAAHFSVGLIPFKVNELTRAVNPIKLQEMLAAGCRVVSTDLPEVKVVAEKVNKAVKGAVTVANTSGEFVAGVRDALAKSLQDEERRQISACVSGATWTAKVREIIDIIEGVAK